MQWQPSGSPASLLQQLTQVMKPPSSAAAAAAAVVVTDRHARPRGAGSGQQAWRNRPTVPAGFLPVRSLVCLHVGVARYGWLLPLPSRRPKRTLLFLWRSIDTRLSGRLSPHSSMFDRQLRRQLRVNLFQIGLRSLLNGTASIIHRRRISPARFFL